MCLCVLCYITSRFLKSYLWDQKETLSKFWAIPSCPRLHFLSSCLLSLECLCQLPHTSVRHSPITLPSKYNFRIFRYDINAEAPAFGTSSLSAVLKLAAYIKCLKFLSHRKLLYCRIQFFFQFCVVQMSLYADLKACAGVQ